MENDIPTARITLTLLSGVRRRIMCPIADDTSFDALCQCVRDGFANACGAAVRNFKVEFIELDGIQCVVQSNSVLRKCLRDYISVAQSSGVEVDFHFLAEEIVEPGPNVPPANEVMDQGLAAPVNSGMTDISHLDFDTVDVPFVVLNERALLDDVPQASTSQAPVEKGLLGDEAVVESSGSSGPVNAPVQNSPPSTPSRPGVTPHSPAKDKFSAVESESLSFKIPKEELFDSQSEVEIAPPQPPAKSTKKRIRKFEKLSERSVTVRKSPKKKLSLKAKKTPPPTLIQDFIASRSCRPTADVVPAKEPKKRMLSHQLGFRDSPQEPSTSRDASFLLVEADKQKEEKASKKARLSVSKVKEKKTSKKITKKHPFSRDSSPEASTSCEANAVASRKKGKAKAPRKPRLAASKMIEKKAFKKSSEGSKTPKKKPLPKESTPELPSPSPPKKHFLRSGRASEETLNVASTSADVEMPAADEVEVVTLSESEQEDGVYKLPKNYNGYEWLTEMWPRRIPYVPQVGDIVNYYVDIHRRYCVSASAYPFLSEKVILEAYQPFDDSFYLELKRVETLEVLDLDFEIISPVDRTRLIIVHCERKNCANPGKMDLTLYLQEIPGSMPQEAEFLVLKQFVDQAETQYAQIGRDGYLGKRAKTLVYKGDDPTWFNGKVERMADPKTESQPVTFLWDLLPGQTIPTEEPVSLWDVFLYPDHEAEVENQKVVGPIELRDIAYKAEAAEWPEEGMRRFTHRLWKIAGFLERMPLLVKNLPLELSNSLDPAAVEKWKFYQSVPYPVTLRMISFRLMVMYYRRKAALEFDIKQLQTTMFFLTDDEELLLKTRIIYETLMEGMSEPNFSDRSVYQFVENRETESRAGQLTAFGNPRRVSFTSPQDRYQALQAMYLKSPHETAVGPSSRL